METWGVWEPDGTLNAVFETAGAAAAWCQRMNRLGRGGWTWGSLGYRESSEDLKPAGRSEQHGGG